MELQPHLPYHMPRTGRTEMRDYLIAEISSSAVRHNLQLFRRHISEGTKLCAVVKADCYGHGMAVLWEVIAGEADWLAVAGPGEGIQLRDLGYKGEILMFFSPCIYRQLGCG